MKIAKMNKKGDAGDWLIIIAGFVSILSIIIVGLLLANYFFFGTGYDSRQADADSLFLAGEDCVEENNFSSEEFDIEEKCRLKGNAFGARLLDIKNIGSNEEVFFGFKDYEVRCNLKKGEKLVKCKTDRVATETEEFEVLGASNANSKKILK